MKYKLQPYVCYRRYGEVVVCYNTKKQTVSLYAPLCADILDSFQEKTEPEAVLAKLRMGGLDAQAEADVREFVGALVEGGELAAENVLTEEKGSVELYAKSTLPEGQLYAVQFELTFRCCERCRHCYCVDSAVPEDAEELTTEQVKKVLDDVYDMGALEVTFTGGELFMRRDVWEILDYAHKKRFAINIFSNGILMTDSDLIRIHNLYPRSVHFSVYSHVPERHDAFTGVEGSFEKTTYAIKTLVSLGVPVNIKTCVMNYNAEDFEGILLLAKNLGTTIQVSLAISAKNDGGKEPLDLRLHGAEEYAAVMRTANEHIMLHCSNNLPFFRTGSQKICGAGSSSLNVDPYGNVFPCNALLLNCGNVKETSIKEIWAHSEMLQKIRASSMSDVKGCVGCPDQAYCNFCPGSALTETGDPLQKYDEACTIMQAKRLSDRV